MTDVLWKSFWKLCASKNLTYSQQNQAKLPTTMPQFPLCKNEKNREKNFQPPKWTKKPHHFFNTKPILEFNMSMINTTENTLTKRQVLPSEQCMVRKTWSHTLNRKKKELLIKYCSPHSEGKNFNGTFSSFNACTVFSFIILVDRLISFL